MDLILPLPSFSGEVRSEVRSEVLLSVSDLTAGAGPVSGAGAHAQFCPRAQLNGDLFTFLSRNTERGSE